MPLAESARREGSDDYALQTNLNAAQVYHNQFTAQNGSLRVGSGRLNATGSSNVIWSFLKSPGFFDVVIYDGDGTDDREIAHNLGSAPGCIIVKRYDEPGDWYVWHRDAVYNGFRKEYRLNGSNSWINSAGFTTSVAEQNAGVFTLQDGPLNTVGAQYVAYVFGNDTSSDGFIRCGGYAGASGSPSKTIDLGWEPQWLFGLSSAIATPELIFDAARGWTKGLSPNSDAAEITTSIVTPLATGFRAEAGQHSFNGEANDRFQFIAVRKPGA